MVPFIIAIILTITCIFIFVRSVSKGLDQDENVQNAFNPKQPSNVFFESQIAGITYHCDKSDIGGFFGYVEPEENNPHDEDACAIYRNDDKLMGYIPRNSLQNYRQWSNCKPLNCVGFVATDPDYPLYGRVYVINSHDPKILDFAYATIIRLIVEELGKKYIPSGYKIKSNYPLRTKIDWLNALDDYINSQTK